MRETLDDGLKNIDMVIFNGEDETGLTQKFHHIFQYLQASFSQMMRLSNI